MTAQWRSDASADWYAEVFEANVKTAPKAKKPRQKFGWRIVSDGNHEGTATAGEQFDSEGDAHEACADFLAAVSSGRVQSEIRHPD
jgi:hypothetical protein